jgi:hypothetical protein
MIAVAYHGIYTNHTPLSSVTVLMIEVAILL